MEAVIPASGMCQPTVNQSFGVVKGAVPIFYGPHPPLILLIKANLENFRRRKSWIHTQNFKKKSFFQLFTDFKRLVRCDIIFLQKYRYSVYMV